MELQQQIDRYIKFKRSGMKVVSISEDEVVLKNNEERVFNLPIQKTVSTMQPCDSCEAMPEYKLSFSFPPMRVARVATLTHQNNCANIFTNRNFLKKINGKN